MYITVKNNITIVKINTGGMKRSLGIVSRRGGLMGGNSLVRALVYERVDSVGREITGGSFE